ncbi:MAG: right-handed parallel beta-helix repeat-containing protein [Candidatus Bathyarchaeia archaeon]
MRIKKSFVLIVIVMVVLTFMSYHLPIAKADLIFVEGHITSNTTWTSNNTYRVIGDVVIDLGVTLLIEPGTQIQFTDGTSLVVTGTLNATGEESNPITFTSSRIVVSTAYRGAWNTIIFNATADEKLTLEHVKIEYATHGVTIKSLKPAVVKNSHILNCSESGILLGGWSSLIPSNVLLESNTIEYNKYGITTDNEPVHAGVVLRNNTIQQNDEEGILLFSGGSYTSATNVHLCYIGFFENKILLNGVKREFGGSGIYIGASSKANASIYDLDFHSNILTSNNATGIYISCSPSSTTFEANAHIYDLEFFNNTVVSNVGGGIYLRARAYSTQQTANSYIHDISFTRNNLTRNYSGITLDCEGTSSTLHDDNAHIYNVQLNSNVLTLNSNDGIRVESTAHNCSIYNTYATSNIATLNGACGIDIDAYIGYNNGYLYDVYISGNIVKANDIGIFARAPQNHSLTQYDVSIMNNVVSGSTWAGIMIEGWNEGGLISNITGNSVAYNQIGIRYNRVTQGNIAHYNDIYNNTYGMNVTLGATVNAENNYWGHPNGPYHSSVWPEGGGNPVNGNGVDLDFIPFLTTNQSTINQRPIAALAPDKTTLDVNETVIFSASASTDDGYVEYYFFDFGDGTNSSWTTSPTVTHQYTEEGIYNATVIVMDNLGATSTNEEQITVQMIVIPEFQPILIMSLFMMATLLAVVIYKKSQAIIKT